MEDAYGIKLEEMVKITTGENSNWAMYLKKETGILYSVAIVSDCNTTTFGNINHLIKMCRMGYRKYEDFTKDGLDLLNKYGFRFDKDA